MELNSDIKIIASEKRERIILDTAYKLWEKDGKPGYWSGARRKYYSLKAIEKLNSPKKLHKHIINHFITAEKQLETFLSFLKTLAILEILGILGNITIVIALISFIATEKQRRNAEIYQAWQVITAAYNQPGSGGRKEALEFLNSEPRRFPLFWLKWQKQSLAGISAPQAYLYKINLEEANLGSANLQKANLGSANLQKVNLESANLQEANLGNANLQKVNLESANLQEANLRQADLQEANLGSAKLQEAKLGAVKLQNANLDFADLQEADLFRANL